MYKSWVKCHCCLELYVLSTLNHRSYFRKHIIYTNKCKKIDKSGAALQIVQSHKRYHDVRNRTTKKCTGVRYVVNTITTYYCCTPLRTAILHIALELGKKEKRDTRPGRHYWKAIANRNIFALSTYTSKGESQVGEKRSACVLETISPLFSSSSLTPAYRLRITQKGIRYRPGVWNSAAAWFHIVRAGENKSRSGTVYRHAATTNTCHYVDVLWYYTRLRARRLGQMR